MSSSDKNITLKIFREAKSFSLWTWKQKLKIDIAICEKALNLSIVIPTKNRIDKAKLPLDVKELRLLMLTTTLPKI